MIVLAIILVLLFLLLILPVGAKVVYSDTGVALYIAAGPLRIQILPKRKKNKKEKEPGAKKKKKSKEPKNKDKKSKKDKKENGSVPKKKLGGQIAFFRQLLGIGLDALGCLRRKLKMNDLVLYLTVGGKQDDAAGSAILYGRAWAAVGALTPLLENTFHIGHRDIQVFLDYSHEENVIYAEACITIRIGQILWVALFYGIKVLIVFIKHSKQSKKGGTKNGTSDQQSGN